MGTQLRADSRSPDSATADTDLSSLFRLPSVRRSPLRAVGLLVAAVLLLGLVWIVVTGFLVRAQMSSARADMLAFKTALLTGSPKDAVRLAHKLEADAGSAHAHTSGPAWWVGAQLPWAGSPLRSWRTTARALDALAGSTLPLAVRATATLSPDRVITKDGGIDVAQLHRAIGPLTDAQSAVDRVASQLAAAPSHSWLGAANSTHAKALRDMTKLRDGLGLAIRTLNIAPAMLGADGPRRYFVAFQDDAEARGLGGMPGAYGILLADHGKFHFTRFGSEYDLLKTHSTASLGVDFRNRYVLGFHADSDFRNSDASPNFPYDAATWLSMWQHKYHQRLDGAIATDPSALSYLLNIAGPITLDDGQKLVPANAVQVLESGIFQKFPGLSQQSIAARKTYLVDAAKAIVNAVTSHIGSDPHGLLVQLARAITEGRLALYSAHQDEQAQIAQTRIAGVLPRTTDPFVGLVLNNAAGSKLDYYLDQRLQYERTTCKPTTSTVTVTLHNDAPASGLPPYVTFANGFGRTPGQNFDVVSLYVTQGADVNSVTVDGRKQFITTSNERGHPVVSFTLSLQPGQTRTIVYKVHEPAAHAPVRIPVQPLVRGLIAKVDSPDCSNG